MNRDNLPDNSQFLLYSTEDGKITIETRLEDETVWLSQKQMSELFQVSVPTINEHIKTIFRDGELSPEATIRKFRIVRTEGEREVAREIHPFNDTIYPLAKISALNFRNAFSFVTLLGSRNKTTS